MVRRSMLYFAEVDYKTVLHLKDVDGLEDSCLFHCEQMIEKLLKEILLLKKGERDFKHSILKLVDYLNLKSELSEYLDLMQDLQDSYFERRYEVFNYVEYSREEFIILVEQSIKLYKILLDMINSLRYKGPNNLSNSSIFGGN